MEPNHLSRRKDTEKEGGFIRTPISTEAHSARTFVSFDGRHQGWNDLPHGGILMSMILELAHRGLSPTVFHEEMYPLRVVFRLGGPSLLLSDRVELSTCREEGRILGRVVKEGETQPSLEAGIHERQPISGFERLDMERIDDAVHRILMVKFAYGLFDKPRPADRFWSNHESFGGQEHRAVAREAVRKSLVLLKNDGPVLPLDKKARIFVAGKNAHNRGHQCGGFSLAWQGLPGNDHLEGGTSVWEGISQLAPNAVLSASAFGSDADPDQHDVAIIVIGERPYAEGLGDVRPSDQVIVEAGSLIKGSMNVLDSYGNTLELASLHPEDLQTVKTVTNMGIPAVVVMISGRPLVVNRELAASSAFVAAWLPGSEGQGVADVLFGDFDFQGRLSFSWPDSDDGQSSGGQSDRAVLFPRGYGMTYLSEQPNQRSRRINA